ncbi:MAG: SMC-Scp complex subunit ScpB [Planctomycetes bacterium]|nr:SMC-Scp complex subunit ScpB [Planctomycetota bacterium]
MPESDNSVAVPEEKLRLLFALMFSSPEPVTQDRVREVLYPVTPDDEGAEVSQEAASPRDHLDALQAWIDQRELPLMVRKVGRAWRLLTSEDVAEELATVRKQVHKERMGPAALEVLSLVAYRQPILKADIDAVRGVKSGPHLRHLLDLRLVRILGRADLPGRPFLYGTTREFLDRFGLQDLKDLPEAGRLANPAEAPPAEPVSTEAAETGKVVSSTEPAEAAKSTTT